MPPAGCPFKEDIRGERPWAHHAEEIGVKQAIRGPTGNADLHVMAKYTQEMTSKWNIKHVS